MVSRKTESNSSVESSIGTGAIYSGGAHAPSLLRVGEARGGTEGNCNCIIHLA